MAKTVSITILWPGQKENSAELPAVILEEGKELGLVLNAYDQFGNREDIKLVITVDEITCDCYDDPD